MKKFLALSLSVILSFAVLSGCSSNGSSGNSAATEEAAGAGAATSASTDNVFKIGVCQLVTHDALDAAYNGFVDGLKEAGYEDGKNIAIDYNVAAGEQTNCVTIADKLVNNDSDLILAIATPAAQAAANKTQDIPILVTAVTDPASSGLVKSNELPETNVSGTSDLNPVEGQINLLLELCPDVKTVAVLYCSSEDNSKFQADLVEEYCSTLGIKVTHATVSNTNEIQSVIQSLVGKADAIYAPTDNMIADAMPTVAMVANENKLPVICGEANMVNNGGLATYGIDYYELGKLTAAQAVRILEGTQKVSEMPIEYLSEDKLEITINEDTASKLGITIPDKYKK